MENKKGKVTIDMVEYEVLIDNYIDMMQEMLEHSLRNLENENNSKYSFLYEQDIEMYKHEIKKYNKKRESLCR